MWYHVPKGGIGLKKGGLSQEGLKCIACAAMLIDHIGAVLLPRLTVLRIIGRMAFPIYCFLLAEGAHYTRDPKRYGIRLAVGALLAEIPFDLAIWGGPGWDGQSVMLTLLLGFWMARCMMGVTGVRRVLVILPFYLAAELLRTDYGGMGILLIALFVLTRELPRRWIWQTVGMAVLCWSGYDVAVGPLYLPIQAFAVLAMIPICAYSGHKRSGNKLLQWGFYLFYPVHLTVLWLLG